MIAGFLLLLIMGSGGLVATVRAETVEIVGSYAHDPAAFTQGLIFENGVMFESTGLYGQSTVRRVALSSGQVEQMAALPEGLFGEGLTLWRDKLVQLTWRSGIGIAYDVDTFRPVHSFRYPGEGWGLTHDGHQLIMSDGTAQLRFLDPETYQEKRRVEVVDGAQPIDNLNELEFVSNQVWANIWQQDRIARISPVDGRVLGWLDFSSLAAEVRAQAPSAGVLNGIAFDAESGRTFITGKNWPRIYEISVPSLTPGAKSPQVH